MRRAAFAHAFIMTLSSACGPNEVAFEGAPFPVHATRPLPPGAAPY